MHFTSFVCAILPALSLGAAVKRIVGGNRATLGQFKSLVSLSGRYGDGKELTEFCGGALLNPTTVLTAAHCVQWVLGEPRDFNVRAGSLYFNESGITAKVTSYVQHPDYKGVNNDFAILKLGTPIPQSENVEFARLQERDIDPVAGAIATIAGWGLDSDGGHRRPDLWWVSIPVVDRKTCEQDFARSQIKITQQMFCAGTQGGGKGDCTGDSGGPVFIDGLVTGLVSFSQGYCASATYPNVYARVSTAIPFIKEHL